MRFFKLIIFPLFFTPFALDAQYAWDFGGSFGPSNYLGEMGGKNKPRRNFIYDLKLRHTRFDASGFARYKLFPFLSAKATLSYVRIAGADSNSTYEKRYYRNLSFRNSIIELASQLEYNVYRANDVLPSGRMRVDFNVYGFAGVGGIYHNPKAKAASDGKWHALQPLGTEGQGRITSISRGKYDSIVVNKKYSRFQVIIPMGFGLYYTIRRNYRAGFELNYRLTFTDYLDDASTFFPGSEAFTGDPLAEELSNPSRPGAPSNEWYIKGAIRGNPKDKDTYMTAMLNFSYVIRGKSNFYRAKYQMFIGAKKKKRKTRAKF